MGWRDLFDIPRITDDDSGGGYTPDYFNRSQLRRKYIPGSC